MHRILEESAKLLRKSNNEKIQFQWLDDEDSDYYFELRIQFDEITKDVSGLSTLKARGKCS